MPAPRAAATSVPVHSITAAAPEISRPAMSSIPPLLANPFCMSTTTTAVCRKSISIASGFAFSFGILILVGQVPGLPALSIAPGPSPA